MIHENLQGQSAKVKSNNVNKMTIEKYTAYFHDGGIRKIQHLENNLLLSMESAQMLPEWNEDNIELSKRDTISGQLFLEGIKNIRENESSYAGEFKTKEPYDRAGIYDFEIQSNTVSLLIWWVRFPPNSKDSDIYKYEIEAEKIYWENISTLFDSNWDAIEKKSIS